MVCSKSFSTSVFAGLTPITFNIPNQKNTTKRDILIVGSEIFLKKNEYSVYQMLQVLQVTYMYYYE